MTQLIADLGSSHGNDFDKARALVHQAIDYGADVVKIYGPSAFTQAQWGMLAGTCHVADTGFTVSAYDPETVKALESAVTLWRVPSGQVTNLPLLRALHTSKKPILLSRGLCTAWEYSMALTWCAGAIGIRTVKEYPTDPHHYCRPAFAHMNGKYGLSDHSGEVWPSIGAAFGGAAYVEVHVRDEDAGTDVDGSVTWAQLHQLHTALAYIGQMSEDIWAGQTDFRLKNAREKHMFREGDSS